MWLSFIHFCIFDVFTQMQLSFFILFQMFRTKSVVWSNRNLQRQFFSLLSCNANMSWQNKDDYVDLDKAIFSIIVGGCKIYSSLKNQLNRSTNSSFLADIENVIVCITTSKISIQNRCPNSTSSTSSSFSKNKVAAFFQHFTVRQDCKWETIGLL